MSGSSFDRVMEERKVLVQQIIENMKNGYVMPRWSWDKSAFPCTQISNPVSNARYRGANFLKLYLEMMNNQYTDNRWMTFKQAQSKGWKVKKGAKGVRLEKYIFDKDVEEENEKGEKERKKVRLKRPMVNSFVVFHASQIDGIPELEIKELKPLEYDEVLEMADVFKESSCCPITETKEGRAYYSPHDDKIVLPLRDSFIDQTAFLATQLHEMVHSTGHKSRLNRDMANCFGSEDYAREELRAELGCFFIETDMGLVLNDEHVNSHTDYLKNWIQCLEEDPNELYRAISDAQKAADFLEERYRNLMQERVKMHQISKSAAAAIRSALKRELKNPGKGEKYLFEWIQKEQEKEAPLENQEQSRIELGFQIALRVSRQSGKVDEVTHSLKEYAEELKTTQDVIKALIQSIYNYSEEKGYQFSAKCVDLTKSVKTCSR